MIAFDFANQCVLVSGASRGIGRVTAQQFAAAGARVAVHYHQNETAARETLSSLSGAGHLIVRGDLADADHVQAIVADVHSAFGAIDILVNNAGIYEEHPLAQVDYAQWQDSWRRVIDTNLVGTANLAFCVAHKMITQGAGRIVNVSSRGAFRGEPDAPAYGASKAGLNAMSQSLAKHLAPHNIFVTTVAPGWVETDMAEAWLQSESGIEIRAQSPLNRVAKAEEVANAILFLASAEAEFLTGAIVDINGASYLRT